MKTWRKTIKIDVNNGKKRTDFNVQKETENKNNKRYNGKINDRKRRNIQKMQGKTENRQN